MTVSMGNQIQIGLLGWTSVVALATFPDFAVADEYEKVWLDELSVRPVNGRLPPGYSQLSNSAPPNRLRVQCRGVALVRGR